MKHDPSIMWAVINGRGYIAEIGYTRSRVIKDFMWKFDPTGTWKSLRRAGFWKCIRVTIQPTTPQ